MFFLTPFLVKMVPQEYRWNTGKKRWNTAIFGIRVEYGVEYGRNTAEYGLDKNTTKMDKK